MAKTRSSYVCQQCGYSQVGWSGRCPDCGTWGSLVETIQVQGSGRQTNGNAKPIKKPVSLTSIPSKRSPRVSTKISELDRVLGGGLVTGQVVLLAGEPGIGKSTLLLQLVGKLGNTLYVSGEESNQQIAIRAQRLGIKNKAIKLLEEVDIDKVIATATQSTPKSKPPKAIIIDSIQTMTTSDLSGLAGSVGQVRECAYRLVRLAKEAGIPMFIVGHVTKEGTMAGPAVLAHIVDTVLWFEGERSFMLRVLRVNKNRFGPTDEVGIFNMEDAGLVPIDKPERVFLSKNRSGVAGTVVTSVLEGTRPILVEVQSLLVPTKLAFSRRIAQGIDSRRLELLIAVLTRRCGIPLGDYDVFVNIAGGINIKEPGADLAICLSIASSFFDKALPVKLVAIGEVGLLGEIREVVAEEKRVEEAKRLGFSESISQKKVSFVRNAIKDYLK